MIPFGSPCGSLLAECPSMSKRAECARNDAVCGDSEAGAERYAVFFPCLSTC